MSPKIGFALSVSTAPDADVVKAFERAGGGGTYRERIAEFADAGFDHVYVHQVGSDRDAFVRPYEREILPVAAR